jgi:hypothetical protein
MGGESSFTSGVPAIIFKWLMIVSGAMFLGAVVTSPVCYRRAKSTQWPTADGVVRSAAGWEQLPAAVCSLSPVTALQRGES